MSVKSVTAVAPVNIAVIKYWGKKDEKLIIPINDSLSVTLSKKYMCAKTTVVCSNKFECDRFWLNGKEGDIKNPRLQNCITEMKKKCTNQEIVSMKLYICSENNFPTAAGLASSAAGFACLVKALSALYEIEDADLTQIARQGSGSACRSIYGGFVHWIAGTEADGSDSRAEQIANKDHWSELKAIILVVNEQQKEISSSIGMQQTVSTSSLLRYRVSNIVPNRVQAIKEAILAKDFHTFAEITMKESNQFHAVCLDTYPPIQYLNTTSNSIMRMVHAYNGFYKENKVAYTFDAGPNACLYLLEKDVPEVLSLILTAFPPVDPAKFFKGEVPHTNILPQVLIDSLQIQPSPGSLKYVISSQVGSGAKLLDECATPLLDDNGFPILGST